MRRVGGADWGPGRGLVGVDPGSGEGADVFGKPDEEGYEGEAEEEGHLPPLVPDSVVYGGAPEKDDRGREEDPAGVG